MKVVWTILLCIAAAIIIYILFLVISALFVDPHKEYDDHNPFYRSIFNGVTAWMLFFCNVKVHLSGKEKLPEKGRFLIVGNHRSNFDSIVTWYILKEYNLAYISKPSNFKIPIFGRLVRRCCFMPIDRENARNALKTIDHAADLIKNDQVSIGVYPEGTRNHGKGLLPFHNGVFKIAQAANVPIVTVVVKGTSDIHKNTPFKRTHVYVDIIDVLPNEYVTNTNRADISNHIRKSMLSALGEPEDNALES